MELSDMWEVVVLWLILLSVLHPVILSFQLRRVNDDSFWVKGTDRKTRIKECFKESGITLLGIAAYTGVFVLIVLIPYAV